MLFLCRQEPMAEAENIDNTKLKERRAMKLIQQEISGLQAWRYAERICQYNRIQASPGYRQAAEAIIDMLGREGVAAELVRYPARYGERFLGRRSFAEWHCRGAELWLQDEQGKKRLCRYQEQEVSLVQRSGPTPPAGVEAELVAVAEPENPDSYRELDLKGKIALVRGNPMAIYQLAVAQHGAIGLVFDNLNQYPPIRSRADMPDALQYTSFWWTGDEQPVFGFCVSPRVGEELRQRLNKGPVRLFAQVDASFSAGSLENIEYLIPGRQEEEVLLVAHLCHPYPGAQDNASGPAVLMEVMRTMARLLREGKLKQPQLGIRFLLVPEMTGTYAYLDRHPGRKDSTVAALNLDMVGADQARGGGPLCVEQPPLGTPTFADRYVFGLLDSISRDITNFSGTFRYSTCHYLQTRFSSGSDHYVLSDPAIGIPCPMLIQWPDRHYHTSMDRPANLDPGMMERVAVVAAAYAWGLAAGDEAHWLEFMTRDVAGRREHLRQVMEWVVDNEVLRRDWQEALAFYREYELRALQSLGEYARVRGFGQLDQKLDWAAELVRSDGHCLAEWARERAALSTCPAGELEELSQEAAERVYGRVYPAPSHLGGELARLPLEERIAVNRFFKESKAENAYPVFLEYWTDGRRRLAEVLRLVKLETGAWHPAFAVKYMELGEKLGFFHRIK